MKKTVSVLLSLILVLLLLPAAFAENTDTLADWNIRVTVPDGATAVLKGDEYYIYPQHEDSIPYVMLRAYRYDSAEKFLADFTDYMRGEYSDLQVTLPPVSKTIGDKSCLETDYSYKVSGYSVRDRRIAFTDSGFTYMFASKEIAALNMTIGSLLEDVVADSVILNANGAKSETGGNSGTGSEQSTSLADAYLYCKADGMPKYWLDTTQCMTDGLALHCYFRSGDPTFYESVFFLDLSTAEMSGNRITIHNLTDEYGFDHSNWFRSLTFDFFADGVLMTADRDERTLAGGSEDNILTGEYPMYPAGASLGFERKGELLLPRTSLRPESDGPFTAEELGRWSQIYYFEQNGFFPPIADTERNSDGSFSIHLYEIRDNHTATSAWYTLNTWGSGSNDITGEAVDLLDPAA